MDDKWKWLPEVKWLVLMIIVTVICILILIFDNPEAFAYEPIVERIPFEEMVKRDEQIAFVEWQRTRTVSENDKKEEYRIEVTEEDIDLMARVVMSEASTLADDAKQGIATTIVNRVLDDTFEFRYQNSVKEVVYHGMAYCTADNGDPDETCYNAVYAALSYDDAFPSDMFWFREDKYHSFAFPYEHIGTTYFSTAKNYNN